MSEPNETKLNEKWVFIVNPIAGNGYAKSVIPVISEMAEKHKIASEIVLTEYPGHASEISRNYYEKGFRYIIGVGGDGTINEVAAPLAGLKNVITGAVPAGTGNDLIQILGFPGRFTEKEWDIFFSQNTALMDAGEVNGKLFLNGMGLGFDAQVASENYVEPGKVKKGGAHKYIWHIVKTLLFFREKKMITTSNGERTNTDCFINTVANGRRFAGGFFLTPGAFANDGLLDVCSIKKLNLYHRFRLLLKVPQGKHIYDRRVRYFQTAFLDIEFPEKVPFHVDGELHFAQKFSIRIIPGAFNVIYNPDGNHFFKKKN
ncbi:MAG: diacylglycerol kinase family lipid kinase [Bacteroidales bacterium]|nr:diacylglycerol kinase family lipid kinase [Bacteroidales bacterium]